MAQTATFTLRIPKPLKKRLEDLAEATDRPQAYLVMEALSGYIETQHWQVKAIQEAVKKADSPEAKFVPHEQVVARMKRLAAKSKRAAS